MQSITSHRRRGVRALTHAAIAAACVLGAAAPAGADGVIQFAEQRLTITEGNTLFFAVVLLSPPFPHAITTTTPLNIR